MDYKNEIHDFVVSNFLFGDTGDFKDDVSFLDTGIVDSAGVLELINFLETRYSITIESNEMIPDNLDSVNSVNAFLKGKLSHLHGQGDAQCAQTHNS
jgi:acyl carrier protein